MGKIDDALDALVSRYDSLHSANKNSSSSTQSMAGVNYHTALPSRGDYGKTDLNPDGIDLSRLSEDEYLQRVNDWQRMIDKTMSDDQRTHFNEYLPRGTAATNVNRKSPEETLRLSRLADAMNNRYYRSPRKISAMSATKGGGETADHTDYGQLYRMPIETEEMRQMERTREYEAATRGREIGRQQSSQDFLALETKRNEFELRLRNAGKFTDEQIREYMKMWDYQYGYLEMARAEMFRRSQEVFTGLFQRLHLPVQQSHIVTKLAAEFPQQAPYLYALFGGNGQVYSLEQQAMIRASLNRLENISDPQQQMIELYRLNTRMMGEAGKAMVTEGVDFVKDTAQDVRGNQ